MFRIGKQQFGQLLVADHVEDEADDDKGRERRDRIEDAAKALPALSFRVEEDLVVGHLVLSQLRNASAKKATASPECGGLGGNGQGRGIPGRAERCTLKIVWKLAKRVN
jgi:hypothetical protein